MSYDFTKGKYRAFIRTTYLDESGVSRIVDGEPEVFDSEAISYFTFKTNRDIKLDPETLEVPNAELTDSGTYKGLEYSFYDNGLAVISGTQTEAVANTDESPWQSDISYIFIKATVISGFVFRNDDCLELQVGYLGFSGNPYTTQLFNGPSYLYLNVSNIDLTTTNRVGPMFYGVSTDDIDGLEDLVNNLPSNITSATGFLGNMEIKGTKSLSFNVSISDFDSHSAAEMFGLCGSNCDVTVHADIVDYKMFGGNADTSNSYLKSLTVIVDSCPADKDYVYMFYRCAAKKITIQQMPMPDPANVPSSFTLLNFFGGCSYLEELVINSDSGFTFNYRSIASLFENCSSLKRIRDELSYNDYIIETSNWFYAPRAFKNCSSLESIPFDEHCQDFPQLYTATEMFYNCFHETEDEWPYLVIGTKGANFENAFENSHFRGVHLIYKKYTGSTSYGINLKEAFKNSDLQLIQFEWDALGYSGYGATSGFISAAEGCTKLKTFQSLIPSNYYPYIVRFDRMFYGCTALEDVSLKYMQCTNTGDIRYAITEDCFTGCTSLKTFTTPGGYFNPFVLPKTMYYNGTAYTEATLTNRTYTST